MAFSFPATCSNPHTGVLGKAHTGILGMVVGLDSGDSQMING